MHISPLTVGFVSSLSLASVALAAPPKCLPGRDESQARAAAVKEAFQFAWDGYYKYAFPHDELRPVTNGFSDSR
jgi:mannosyl-oligosaccharide alpha-1,2-mannosidase